ncbi:MAG: PQ-loop domain-containing transporter [Gammaproteobacteria bacterium]
MELTKELINFLFGLGLVINALLFVPQIIKLIKEKNSSELSIITFGGFFILQLLSVLHGIIVRDYILAVGFCCSLLTCGTVLLLIFFYRKKKTGRT